MAKTGLSEADYQAAAEAIGCDVAAIKAVVEVESPKGAFYEDGFPVILFERHKFHQFTGGKYDKSHPTISNPTPGGYGGAGANQRRKFSIAFNLDPEAAMKSCSWGRFQIMGFNHKEAGFKTVGEFVDAMKRSEADQLAAFIRFIKSSNLGKFLRNRQWAEFARAYNGPGYKRNNYDVKIAKAYAKYSKLPAAPAEASPSLTVNNNAQIAESTATSDTVPPVTPTPEVEIPKQRPSTFTRISAAVTAFVGFLTMIGINLGILISEKLREVPAEWFFLGIGAIVLIAIAIWAYDRSAERSNRLNQKLIETAADPNKITVKLDGGTSKRGLL